VKKIAIPFILFSLCFLKGISQNTFQKAFGGSESETGTCIQHTSDGNYIISGYTNSFTAPFRDAYLIKTDTAGNILWSDTYGGSNDEVCYYVALVTFGRFAITGGTKSFGAGENDVFLSLVDPLGNTIWTTLAGGAYDDYGWSAVQTIDRGFLVAGFSEACLGGCYQGLLVKTDSAGTVLWTKILGGSGEEILYGMARTNDGGYIVTGETSTNSFGSSDTWLIRLNAIGDTLWTRFYGSPYEESGAAVRQTADGGFIITGDLHNAFNIHHASLLKTDSVGNLQWAKTFGTPDTTGGGEFGWDVRQLPDYGYMLVGSTPNYGNSMQVFVVRTDSMGDMLWSKTYGGSQADDPWYSILTADGGLAVVGATQSYGSGQSDVYLLKIDSLGSTNSCNDSLIVPEAVDPILLTGSGTTITTGMTSSNPLMTVNNPATVTTNVCQQVGTEEIISHETDILIYPNPLSTSATIQIYDVRFTNYDFVLYDITGREVFVSELRTPVSQLERGNLQSGMYFYKVTGGKGQGTGGKGQGPRDKGQEIIGTGKLIIE
jgi:hypothetical protein